MTQEAPSTGIPVEFVWPNQAAPMRLQEAGHDLRFPADPKHLTPDGQPRRLEWVHSLALVERITGPLYNNPGGPRCFAVAEDLLQDSRNAVFRRQVVDALGPDIVRRPELEEALEDARQDKAIGALEDVVTKLRQRVADLEQAVTVMQAARKAPPKPKPSPANSQAPTAPLANQG